MTKIRKVFCALLSLCFFAVLAASPGRLFSGGNIYGQLPLYRFLEKTAGTVSRRDDPETYQLLAENNARYLEAMTEKENRQDVEENAQEQEKEEETVKEEESVEEEKKPAASVTPPAETEDTSAAQTAAAALPHPEIDLAPETLADYNYLLNHFFIVDPGTVASEQLLNAVAFF